MKSMIYSSISKNDTHITIFLRIKHYDIGSINHTLEYEFGVMKEIHGMEIVVTNPEKNVIKMKQYVTKAHFAIGHKNITSSTEFFKVCKMYLL